MVPNKLLSKLMHVNTRVSSIYRIYVAFDNIDNVNNNNNYNNNSNNNNTFDDAFESRAEG